MLRFIGINISFLLVFSNLISITSTLNPISENADTLYLHFFSNSQYLFSYFQRSNFSKKCSKAIFLPLRKCSIPFTIFNVLHFFSQNIFSLSMFYRRIPMGFSIINNIFCFYDCLSASFNYLIFFIKKSYWAF